MVFFLSFILFSKITPYETRYHFIYFHFHFELISPLFCSVPRSVCIHPWSRLSLRSECKCRVIAATIPGTPATVSKKQIRL